MAAAGERQLLTIALWVLAVQVSYALEPVVGWLERHSISRPFGAPVVVLLVLGLMAGASYSLIDDAVEVIEWSSSSFSCCFSCSFATGRGPGSSTSRDRVRSGAG